MRAGRIAALALVASVGFAPAAPVAGLAEVAPATSPTAAAPRTDVPTKWAAAVDLTREDSYYPDVGDPGVDMLHHDLHLFWSTEGRALTGYDALTFRATRDAPAFRLDLGEPLEVSQATLDGTAVRAKHTGDVLTVETEVRRGRVYLLELGYAGTPEPTPAPTTRGDFDTLGFTITDAGEVWTMQEPYGAFTWLPVNDQPADKAFYDVSITADAPFVGVSNGTLVGRTTAGGTTLTTWHNAAPMASYLLTLGIGPYTATRDTTRSGVPLTYWVLPDQRRWLPRLRRSAAIIDWLEKRLGPYPFDSAGVLLNDSNSGMETQTLLSLGGFGYATSAPVLAHEYAHQWYGDRVGPTDWRDLWMNEGMAMYLQAVYEAEHGGPTLKAQMAQWATWDGFLRREHGPPGYYHREEFGESNAYLSPGLMWHQLRLRWGDRRFWDLVRRWPQEAGTSETRVDYLRWLSHESGEDLHGFFADWLLGDTTPPVAS